MEMQIRLCKSMKEYARDNEHSMIAAIIQARMGSTRLPGKVLSDICGYPMLGRIINRISAVPEINKIIIATTVSKADDILVDWVRGNTGCSVFRGSEHDVLERYFSCSKEIGAEIIVRVTADDPLKDPSLVSRAIRYLMENTELDYCSNTLKPTYPEGLDIEVFRFSALESAYKEATLESDREHVTPYIWRNPDKFHIQNFQMDRDLSAWRWTVDNSNDLELVRKMYMNFIQNPLFSYSEAIEYVEQNLHLLEINSGIRRNEGYIKSVERESK